MESRGKGEAQPLIKNLGFIVLLPASVCQADQTWVGRNDSALRETWAGRNDSALKGDLGWQE